MMYSDVVHRTQIYLDDQEVSALEAAVVRTGASRSELIRRAIRAQYGEQTVASRLEALRSSAGAWTGRDYTGAQFVDAIRGDVNERLVRLRSS
jgi:Arc/MetJ-type ribon-helix-helix transcriptional regulator